MGKLRTAPEMCDRGKSREERRRSKMEGGGDLVYIEEWEDGKFGQKE